MHLNPLFRNPRSVPVILVHVSIRDNGNADAVLCYIKVQIVSCLKDKYTVNSEIFERVLFSRDFAYAKCRENQILAKWRNHSVVYQLRKIMPKSRIFSITNMSYNAILENFWIYSISSNSPLYLYYFFKRTKCK